MQHGQGGILTKHYMAQQLRRPTLKLHRRENPKSGIHTNKYNIPRRLSAFDIQL